MNHPLLAILLRIVSRKLAVILLLAVSAIGAFATLGDGKIRSDKPKRSLLTDKTSIIAGSFSLKSGYTYRGNQVIAQNQRYISLNTVVSYQKGHTTYTLPLKKKVILENVKIDISNRQLRRN